MTNLARVRFRVGVSSMAIALVLSGQARAEDTASDSEDVLRADTVIVTATRREETVQDLPFSVTAVNGDDLAEHFRLHRGSFHYLGNLVNINFRHGGIGVFRPRKGRYER